MTEPKHIEDSRQLIHRLNDVLPLFMQTFNETASPGLANLLNEITPTIISCRQALETFRDMEAARHTRQQAILENKLSAE